MAAPWKSITQQIRENILVLVLSYPDINERMLSETTLAKKYKINRVTLREALPRSNDAVSSSASMEDGYDLLI